MIAVFLSARMATDMKISLYSDEDINAIRSRLTYSAIGEWIKASAYDTHANDENKDIEGIGATKNHITRKCGKILAAYLDLYPDLRDWYYPPSVDETFNPITEIRSRQLAAGVLVPALENSLQFPQEKCARLADDLYLYRGDTFHKETQVIGLGSYIHVPDGEIPICSIEDMYLIPGNSAKDYLKQYVQEMWDRFTNCENSPQTRRYFNYHSPYAFSKSWNISYPTNGNFTIYKDSESDYGIARMEFAELYTFALPQAVIETSDVRRFMYAIREIEQNPAQATIKDLGNMIQITLPSYLPDLEQSLFYMIAWPKRDIMDRIEYISEKRLLPTVRKILENLNIRVKVND